MLSSCRGLKQVQCTAQRHAHVSAPMQLNARVRQQTTTWPVLQHSQPSVAPTKQPIHLATHAPPIAAMGRGTPGRDLLSGEYDAAANANVWERRPIPVITRLITICVEFAKWHLGYPDDPPPPPGGIPGGSRTRRKARRAAAMRELLVRLGPAFVKIGQALSSRPDVLPPAYLVELEALQDRIPAFDSDMAFQVVEQELGVPLHTVFSEISEQPVAAASLGQVYRAVLASDGQVVAVKVQRPGVAEAIALDVYILRWLAAFFRKLRKLNTDLPALVDEWATSLFRELDYRREARNATRFRELYSQLEGVYVPEMCSDLTTAKVLTMEWVEGERLRTVADNLTEGSSPSPSSAPDRGMMNSRRLSGAQASTSRTRGSVQDLALVEIGVRCSLEQMLEHGFYHADPHPGNLLKTSDGRLAYLDFGMCGELDAKTSQALIRATLHLVNREYAQLAQDFIDLGLLPPGSDKNRIIPALTGVFQQALSRGVSNVSFGDLSGQLGRTMYQFSFRIPPYYTLLVRSLTVLEGIALASNPNYKVLGSAYPWIARRLLTNQTPELQDTLRALLYTPSGTFRFARLESLLQEAVRIPSGLSPAVTDSLPPQSMTSLSRDGSALSLLLSPEANFVRDILLDELAKGIDAGWRVGADTALYNARYPLPLVSSVPVIGPLLVPLFQAFTTYSPHEPRQATATAPPAFSFVPWPTAAFPPLFGSGSGDQSQKLEDQALSGPVGALLAAVPALSSPQDQEQLDGISRLAGALAALATSRANAGQPQASATSTSPGVLGLGVIPEPSLVISQLQQASEALRWLVEEISVLPESHKQEAMKLPAELAKRLASRFTARTIRGAFGDNSSSAAPPSTDDAQPSALLMAADAVPAQLRPGKFDAVQDTLAGSSIV